MSSKPFSDINISDYSEKSIVVRGDTRKYKEDLKKLGGKYNGRLSDGPGWIFPKKIERELKSFVSRGIRLVSKEEEKSGEDKTKAWESQEQFSPSSVFSTTSSKLNDVELKKLSAKIDKLSNKIDAMFTLMLEKDKGGVVVDDDSEVVVDSDSEEDEVVPTKRLLGKK